MTAHLSSAAAPAFDPPAGAPPGAAEAGHVALETLTALAGGLCADAGLRVLPSEGGWACAIERREIYVPVGDLDTLGLPTCAGVLAHECGHALITRRVASAPLAAPLAAQLAAQLGPTVAHRVEAAVGRLAHTLSNALEDGRFLPEPGGGWRWSDGAVVRALKRGEWLVLDELNLADPGVLERLNPLLEAEPSLVVTEHAGERLGPGGAPIHPDFRVFATLNPATYSGRHALVRVLVARAGHPDPRAALPALMDANGLGPTTWAPARCS